MDILDQLGLAERGAYGKGGGYEAPPMASINVQPAGVTGAVTEPLQSKPLEAARVLARLPGGGSALTGRGGRGGNVASALGGHQMMKTPPSNKAAAVLDGLMGGFADSERSRSAAIKASDDQLKQRFSMLKDLFGMDRQIAGDKRQEANDTFNQADRTRGRDIEERRAASYDIQARKAARDKTADPETALKREKLFDERVNAESPAAIALAADDEETIPRRKLPPEKRQAIQAQAAQERAELRKKYKMDADTEAATPEATPAAPGAVPQPGLTPGSVSGTPEPGLSPEEMATGAESNPALVSPPVRQDRTALILQSARDHIAKGADRALVEAKMRDEYGVDPALLDME